MGASGSVPSKNRIQSSDQPPTSARVTGKITNTVTQVEQNRSEIPIIPEAVLQHTKTSSLRRFNIKSYEKHDEEILNDWSNILHKGHKANIIPGDGLDYSANTLEPHILFSDLVQSVDEHDILKGVRVREHQVVLITVKGYASPIASCLRMERYCDGSDNETTTVFSKVQTLACIAHDQKLSSILQNSILPSITIDQTKLPSNRVSDTSKPIVSIPTVGEFEKIMTFTEECLIKIEAGMEFSIENISTYMWTSLGIPLLHFAVSVDNIAAVKKLLDCGARIENKDCFGRNALFYIRSHNVATILIQKLTELDLLESEICSVDTNSQLISHVLVSNYYTNPGLTKSVLLEISKSISKEMCISLFNSLNGSSKTAIDVLNSQVYNYAKKFKNTSHHTLMTYLFEEIKWQIENKMNFHQLLQTKLITGGSLSFFSEAASEENIALLHYLLENRIIDNDIDISEYITSVHVAKMVVQLVPEIFDRYIHDNTENTSSSSALSRVILNMRSGNIPLINFIIEQYDYKLLPQEINQIIELAINKRTQTKMMPVLEKCISNVTDSSLIVQTNSKGEIFSKLKKANTFTLCSPFEFILSLDRSVSDGVAKIEKVMWDRIKSIAATDDSTRSLLLNSCGCILSVLIKNKKLDMIEDVVAYLLKFGLTVGNLSSNTGHHKWSQEDMIYNSISSLFHRKEDVISGLTLPLLKSLISVTRNREDLQTHILILALYIKKADISTLKKLLTLTLSFPCFGNEFEITDDLKVQFLDFDDLKLKKFVQPCTRLENLPPVCESVHIELSLDKSRKSEVYPLLIKDGVVQKDYDIFIEKCDITFFKKMADNIYTEYYWTDLVQDFCTLVLEKNFKDVTKLEYLIKKDPECINDTMKLCIIKDYLGQNIPIDIYTEIASLGEVNESSFEMWKKCYAKNKNISWNSVKTLLLKGNIPCAIATGLYRLDLLEKIIPDIKLLKQSELMDICQYLILSIKPNTEIKRRQIETLTDTIVQTLTEESILNLLPDAIKKANCDALQKIIHRIEEIGLTINWEDTGIIEGILNSLRSGCDNLLFTLLSSKSLTLERLLNLKSQENMAEQPIHAICFGGCVKSLQYIYETLPKDLLVPYFFSVLELYPQSSNQSGQDDEFEDYEHLPFRELSVPTFSLLSSNVKMNNLVFEIMRDIAMTTPIPKSIFGNWDYDQNIFQRLMTSKNQVVFNTFRPYTIGKSLWMQHLVDHEEIYLKSVEEYGENAKVFIRMIIVNLIFGDETSFKGSPEDKKLWVDFFRCYFRLKCFRDGDFNIFLQGFKNLTEKEVLFALQDYFYDMEKSKIATELLEIMKFNPKGSSEEVPRSYYLVDIIVKEWDNLLRYILDVVNESEEIENQFWTMREDLELSVKYLNPKYENKCVELLFGKCKFLGEETHDLLYCENQSRIVTVSDEIRIAELRGKVLRGKVWSYRKAERDVGQYVYQKVKFEPPLPKFSEEQAKILTSISVFGDVENMIGHDNDITEIHVIVTNSAQNLKSSIENGILLLRVYLEKETIQVGELEGGNKYHGFN
ncbi:predicted protein [Naegleria gruberi]|uniref:Predicted protein n=1 Tax=Naegleria gruberi TaxID=5762 RepID=D2V9D8_NAEGR|nr:uncharacterized protein NAEGRDRAFT_65405 [Naegleria gruberi]EFC46442.1 predicted protein [Naegleria gruberi]|eukprot:XP_002679186.1 predicted protein [Naegleria gruberi strain NEG-M]